MYKSHVTRICAVRGSNAVQYRYQLEHDKRTRGEQVQYDQLDAEANKPEKPD